MSHSSTHPPTQPIALVGMSCRLPGADGLDEFWRLLVEGRHAIVDMPPERLDRRLYYDPRKGQRGKTYSTLGGLVADRAIAPATCPLDADEAQRWDPCHVNFCEVACAALSDAGLDVRGLQGRRGAVYVGHSGGSPLGSELVLGTLAGDIAARLADVESFAALSPDEQAAVTSQLVDALRGAAPRRQIDGGPALDANAVANIVAETLGLTGPAMAIEAACASSLVALVAAVNAVCSGQAEFAIAGGASFAKADSLVLFSHAQSCSATGTRPFDDTADGLIGSEGYVAVVVKTLQQALADGDRIHAVISGLGVSADGRGRSLWAPRKEGQALAMQRAYAGRADAASIQYLEAHATSTQIGDATEMEAIAEFFAPRSDAQRLLVGSVKSNVGHTLETAGMAGLVKTVLSMQRGVVPPSVGVTTPNETIPWDKAPVVVPTEPTAWPETAAGQPRRAGVNAFGIGGLNVHVVLEQYDSTAAATPSVSHEPQADSTDWDEPIAIVGRGLVVPGANTAEELAALVASGQSMIGPPPVGRWRDHGSVAAGNGPWRTATNQGGFITDYQFDWRTHRVPPKQIAQANPLQFMLLDAARRAIAEAGDDEDHLQRESTAVVVGSIFGGEFAHELVAGLRLPVIRQQLRRILQQSGYLPDLVVPLLDEFEETLLAAKPALVDETGSFTSSTLASRISKELNLQGGALAVDAGECSSLAALDVACRMLRSGAISQAVCAGAQRSMDLANFEVLTLQGRLKGSRPDAPEAGFVPGEGVAVVLLKRLSDARRDGNRVLGVIGAVDGEFRSDAPANDGPIGPLVKTLGHLLGAQGLTEVIHATTQADNQDAAIQGNSPSGLSYRAELAYTAAEDAVTTASPAAAPLASAAETPAAIYRFAAESADELSQLLATAGQQATALADARVEPFAATKLHRAAIVATGNDEARRKLQLAASKANEPNVSAALAGQGIFCGVAAAESRVAFLFPGQSSQYAGMMAGLAESSPAAAAVLAEADAALAPLCGRRFADLAWSEGDALGVDIWATQVAILVADMMLAAWLREMGIRPDVAAGHSYGEFAAMVASGVLTLPQGLRITKARTEALHRCHPNQGALVSLQASAGDARHWIERTAAPLTITHENGPRQTVVGGAADAVQQFAAQVAAQGVNATVLPVPCAFHTDLLRPAQPSFAVAMQAERLLPPTTPLLSSVGNRYVADPAELRTLLVDQLVTPVDYVGMARRLHADGCTLLVEAGPQLVLTRLNQQILGDEAVACVAADARGRDFPLQRLYVQAQCEVAGALLATSRDMAPASASEPVVALRSATGPGPTPVHFDATASRRQRVRSGGRLQPAALSQPPAAPPAHFDGTQNRRDRTRSRNGNSNGHTAPLGNGLAAHGNGAADSSRPATSLVPQSPRVSSAAAPATVSGGLEKFLVDFVVEQTGYPPEIIELDWDMEADLGIDSIKKAQLFGELREIFDLENSLPAETRSRFTLDQFRTLRDVLALLAETQGKQEWLAAEAPPADAPPEPPARLAAPRLTEPHSPSPAASNGRYDLAPTANNGDLTTNNNGGSAAGLEQFLIDFVVEQTGYPPEIIELDADFEADLGIDSIKKAQLFGELREHFSLQVDSSDRRSLSDFRTLRDVVEFLGEFGVARQGALDDRPAQSTRPASTVRTVETARLPGASATTAPTREPPVARISPAKSLVVESLADNAPVGPAYAAAVAAGREHAGQIANQLFELADRLASGGLDSAASAWQTLSDEERQTLHGLAEGAQAPLENLVAYHVATQRLADLPELPGAAALPADCAAGDATPTIDAAPAESELPSTPQRVTKRRVLRMKPAPHLDGSPTEPELAGPAVILGIGPVADELQRRIESLGQQAHLLDPSGTPEDLVAQFDALWSQAATPHLFLATAREPDARTTLNRNHWDERRRRGIMAPFWLCQRWIRRMTEAGLMDEGSLTAIVSLGGDFGLGGRVVAAESGAQAGMLKSIVIENWMNGCRTLPVKVIDAAPDEPAAALVDGVMRELAAPSYDPEIAWRGGQRFVIRAKDDPLDAPPRRPISRGGNWVFTGGARGITAYVVEQLAARFGLQVHLLGVTPAPQLSEQRRRLWRDDPKALKLRVMTAARDAGDNPVKAWERAEKALEIDATMRRLRDAGVTAHYHACDVADRDALGAVLSDVRRLSGPIHGIVHGAGVGKDARFENKDPQKVDQCFGAKADGALALMELTADDPLEHFAAFGSISGRFGANGHTDYSAANDMLAKLVDWYRGQRPEVAAVAFHWHAWGDVGMATKPETRLALEMINMQFMPAAEGIAHLQRELEAGAPEGEVLITDDRYDRLFYPSETRAATDGPQALVRRATERFPLLERGHTTQLSDQNQTELPLHPVADPFLAEHRLDDRPLLPIVVGLELLAEAGSQRCGGAPVRRLRDVRALNGLKFASDQPQTVQVAARDSEVGSALCELTADVHTRSGVLVEPQRPYLRGIVETGPAAATGADFPRPTPPRDGWRPIEYPALGSKFYLGPPLRCLRRIHVAEGEAWGRLVAPAAVEITGPLRSVDGWTVPSAALDACLFATGVLAWFTIEPGTALPESIGSLTLGRLTRAGESCLVHSRFKRREDRYAWFDFTLYGVNGDMLADVVDYRVVWLPGG